jgi:hypothetical protein
MLEKIDEKWPSDTIEVRPPVAQSGQSILKPVVQTAWGFNSPSNVSGNCCLAGVVNQ